ncbi:MAG: DNA internalization-related competence protein ComEC/Rec2 [Lachnospiraceae bacterium]|nr:DNA internalization-related competence protein ComEC/Rec2 [Lachnospiraceae bacterium]
MTDWCGGSWIWKSPAGKKPWQWAEQEQKVQAEGVVYRIEKTTRTVIYLKKAILIRSGSTKNYPIRNIKCTGKEEKINSLREGMHVRLEGMLVLPELPRNPGQFNRRIYESGKKIDFYLENPTVLEVKEQRSGVREVVEIWKTEMMNRCEKIYPDEEAGILEAMLFGEKSELSGDIKELYQAAGISHVLVISGLHISLLALAVAGILRRLGFPMPVWVILSVGVLAGYGILIGQPTTAVRALLMFFVLQGARLLGRSYDLLSALAFAGILMLLDNPDLILDGGCRLSFCAVIGVGWYVSEKNKIFRSIGEKEKRKNRGKGGKGSSAGAMLENIRAGWYLWLFTLPVMLDTFYQVSVVGLLWNLVAIPLLPVIIASGGLGVVLAGWNIFLGSLAGSPAYGMLQLYQEIGNISEKLPVGMWTPGQPSKPVIAGYYLVIFLLVLVEKQLIKREKRWKIFPGMELCSMLLLLLLMAHPWQQREKITFLDVGQGDASLLQSGGQTLLLDGGSTSQKNVGTYVILPYIKQQGISCLEAVVLTHTDQDHINGVTEVLEEGKKGWLTVKNLMYPYWMEGTEQGKQLKKLAEEAGASCRKIRAGDRLTIGKAEAVVLYPKEQEKIEEPNAGSLVLFWKWEGVQAMFTGDLPEEKERELLQNLPACEILQVGHHGSATSTCREFLEQVQPSLAVISCAMKNRYGHPSPDTVDRLKKTGCEIRYTMKSGAITIRKRGREVLVTEYLEHVAGHGVNSN